VVTAVSLQAQGNTIAADELLALVHNWRSQGLEIGFTCGAFDLLHAGHVDYLQKAKALCDRLVVGVNSDESIRNYKSSHRPIVSQEHRMKLVSALRCVDAVVLMNDTRPANLIATIRPDLYIKGGDYEKTRLKSAPLVESYGGRCEVIAVEHDISSSAIVRRIEELARYAEPERGQFSDGPVVCLDRDGTLIEKNHFLKDPARVMLLTGVGKGLRLLQDHGFRLTLVTNQQGIGLGYFEYDDFVAVNSAMLRQLAQYDVTISKIYYCPHSLAEQCSCRKPGSRLIERVLSDFHVEPLDCFMIGDTDSDIAAAENAGCKGILVDTDHSFLDAARAIIDMSKTRVQ
jgi:rfaE bifunctional protein nucleotidyltransferase chain/domain